MRAMWSLRVGGAGGGAAGRAGWGRARGGRRAVEARRFGGTPRCELAADRKQGVIAGIGQALGYFRDGMGQTTSNDKGVVQLMRDSVGSAKATQQVCAAVPLSLAGAGPALERPHMYAAALHASNI